MSVNDFANMIAELQSRRVSVIPKGFKTAKQWSLERGVTQNNIHRDLGPAVLAGIMEKKRFNIKQESGVRSVLHYRIIKQK